MKTLLFIITLAAASFAQTPTPTPEYSDSDVKPVSSPTPAPVAGVALTELQARAKTQKLNEVRISYDKFKDKAVIATKPQNLIGGMESFAVGMADSMATGPYGSGRTSGYPTALYLSIGIEIRGEKLTETPELFAAIFTSNSHGWVFLKGDDNFYVLYDDQRLELHPVGKDSDIAMRSVSETLAFGITRADLEKIIKAKKVEVKLGDTIPRKWKTDWSKRISQLLEITTIK